GPGGRGADPHGTLLEDRRAAAREPKEVPLEALDRPPTRPAERQYLEGALRTADQEPSQTDPQADRACRGKRPPSSPQDERGCDGEGPELQHHRRAEGEPSTRVVIPACDEGHPPRRERDRNQVEP